MTSRAQSGVPVRVAAAALAVALLVAFVPAPALGATPGSVASAARHARGTEARSLKRAPDTGVRALADADSDIPGALTLVGSSGTYVATLTAWNDADDVFRVTLAAGDVLLATIKGPAKTQFDLWMYPPTATSSHTAAP